MKRHGIDRVVEAVTLYPVYNDGNGLPASWIIYTPGGALSLSEVRSWAKTWAMRGKKDYPDGAGDIVAFSDAIDDDALIILVKSGKAFALAEVAARPSLHGGAAAVGSVSRD